MNDKASANKADQTPALRVQLPRLHIGHEASEQALIRYAAIDARSRSQFCSHSYVQRLKWHLLAGGDSIRKRMVDFTGSLILLTSLSPLLVAIALLIKLDSVGPVFFKEIRVGKLGRSFRMWKFRSMYQGAEARKSGLMRHNEIPGRVLFKMRRDPRVTRFGRFLRRHSLDELPQLLNVLKGEMSLVGPRPAVPDEVALYWPMERRRLEVTPGMTCLWQVSGRSELPFEKQVEMDIAYIETQSIWLDLKLMLRTLPVVLNGRGGY